MTHRPSERPATSSTAPATPRAQALRRATAPGTGLGTALALATALALILAAGAARAQDSMAPLDPMGLFGAPTPDMSRDLPPAAPPPSDDGWGIDDPAWILPEGTDLYERPEDSAYGPSSPPLESAVDDPAAEEAAGWDGWNDGVTTGGAAQDPTYDAYDAADPTAGTTNAPTTDVQHQAKRPFFSDDLAIEPTFGLGWGTEPTDTRPSRRGLDRYGDGDLDGAWDAGRGWDESPFAATAQQEDTTALPGVVPGVSIDTGDGGIVRSVLPPLGSAVPTPDMAPTAAPADAATAAATAPGLPQNRSDAAWSAHRVAEVLDALADGGGDDSAQNGDAASESGTGPSPSSAPAPMDAFAMVADPTCDAWLRVDQPSTVSTAVLLDAPCLAGKDVYVVMDGVRVERMVVDASGGMQAVLGHQGATHPFRLVDARNGNNLLVQATPDEKALVSQER